ncbi:uncharacterized protein [Blastocystis hominis]|uniref:Uncharacterized protein n=1 Tax=Blastocystis hominis TaxID=12968 RepID=D8MA42_BLAHO|nr:uncharacterized protein [Blastocystis hominis]CBK24931.2 unnamed protein product [Blastocystis hominis]|eukprot:XP_012898979.1 uncharacterized protein [Blastocystis hominis]
MFCRHGGAGNLPHPSQLRAVHQRFPTFQYDSASFPHSFADFPRLSTVYFEEKALLYTSEIRFQSRSFHSVSPSRSSAPFPNQIRAGKPQLLRRAATRAAASVAAL